MLRLPSQPLPILLAPKSSFDLLLRTARTDDPGENDDGHSNRDSITKVQQGTIRQNPPPSDLAEIPRLPIAADYNFPLLQNIIPLVSTPAGRLVHFLGNWEKLTSDKTILQTVKGYKIPLRCTPHQWRPGLTKGSSKEQTMLLETAINELQGKEH